MNDILKNMQAYKENKEDEEEGKEDKEDQEAIEVTPGVGAKF